MEVHEGRFELRGVTDEVLLVAGEHHPLVGAQAAHLSPEQEDRDQAEQRPGRRAQGDEARGIAQVVHEDGRLARLR